MVVKIKIILWALFPFVFLSCAKNEIPENWEGDPVFVFDGTIGGESVVYQAGIDGYGMHTHYIRDTSNIWAMRGILGPENCPEGCTGSLEVRLYDPQIFPNVNADRSAHTERENWILASGAPQTILDTIDVFTFFSDNTLPANQGILWDFQGGDTTSIQNPVRIFSGNTFRNVCLTTSNNNCNNNICNRIYTRSSAACRVQFFYQPDTAGTYTYTFTAQSASNVTWDFGDGSSATGNVVTHAFSDTNTFRVCAQIGGSCNTSFCRDVQVMNNTQCGSGYSWQVNDSITAQNVPGGVLGSVVLIWKDESGRRFQNFVSGRSVTSAEFFRVKNIESYNSNREGDPTVKITANADVWLFADDNSQDSIMMSVEGFVFALPQP
ncbi:MAG: PKD domain-containing protein [Cryomorphaceae bacterium]|nr:PKD domain-containing protein [Cryomorphaceae bacterium]